MATVSQFATPERLQSITDALDKLKVAKKEAQLAVQAGIPGAAETLKKAEDMEQRILQLRNTYFPEGTSAG